MRDEVRRGGRPWSCVSSKGKMGARRGVPAVVHKSTSGGTRKYQQWYSKVPALELESTSSEMEVVRRARLSREAEMVARSVGRLVCWSAHGILGNCWILRKNLTQNHESYAMECPVYQVVRF